MTLNSPGFGIDGPESWQKMPPKSRSPQDDLFGARLSKLLNSDHPLYGLAEQIDWSEFDAPIDACYAEELAGRE